MCHVHFVRAVLKNVAKKHQKEIADKLKDALADETKMQELTVELESRGYSKSADTIERFQGVLELIRYLFLMFIGHILQYGSHEVNMAHLPRSTQK